LVCPVINVQLMQPSTLATTIQFSPTSGPNAAGEVNLPINAHS
jgi:hypothetical protein